MATTYTMRVSSNGQVSIPAEVRNRWAVDRVLVVDLGDRVVLRPLPDAPIEAMRGKYRGRGPDTDRARATARAEEDRRLRRAR